MHIDELLASVLADGEAGRFSAEVSDDWAQGRTLFGGVQAMLAVRAMRLMVPEAPPLWSLQSTFVAPIEPGRVRLQVQVLRQGRSAMQLEARLLDGAQTAMVAVGVFGEARESTVRVDAPQGQPVASEGAELPFMPGITPNFTQHYAYRWAEGGLPFSGSREPGTRIHLRQRDAGFVDEAHLVALADSIPPPALSLLDKPTPASTLSWSLEFVRHLPPQPAEQWWRMDAGIVAARDGYSSQDAHLFGPDGQLVALSRQVVAVFG
ncbi:thioesterase family protein [Neisseriaceae bacterium JH1-16]|nr:thioesterase family protein [Neisseriaceae bacterium JH1-16]